MSKLTLKDMVLIPVLAATLYAQQLFLSFIPNIQLTTLLILVYTKTLGFKRTALIVTIHTILYNFLNPLGPMLPIFLPFMLISWFLYIGINKLVNNNIIILSFIGLFFGFFHGWILAIPSVISFETPFWIYIYYDLPFELAMGVSGFFTILWIYPPLYLFINQNLKKNS